MTNLTVGWRILCADCGSNCDLHACFVDCEHGDTEHGECNNENLLLCSECIEKREENESEKETQDAEECAGNDVLDCVGDCDDVVNV